MSWFLTCQAVGQGYIEEMAHMVETFQMYHPTVPVITRAIAQEPNSWQQASNMKVEWLRQMLNLDIGDVLWVDADARFRHAIEPPTEVFHIGAQDYTKVRWRISTGTTWLRQSDETKMLMDRWLVSMSSREVANGEKTNEDVLADTLKQTPAVIYYELPTSMTSVCSVGDRDSRWDGTLEHDSAIVHWNRSRRILGNQMDWPPSEEVRRQC
jgi:hypothetical protein